MSRGTAIWRSLLNCTWILFLVSGVSNAADTTPPTAPSGLTATAVSGNRINLSWTAATDDVGVTAYYVERCQGAGCTNFALVTSVSGSVSFNNTGLVPSTSYSFRVRARDAQLNFGPYSNVASATTLAADTIAPTAPTGLAGTVVNASQINLSWTASTDNYGVTGYRVERCQGAGCTSFTQVGTPSVISYISTGLAQGTNYSFRVRAIDEAGNLGGYSNVTSATTGVPPTAPSGLTATAAVSGGRIDLSWAAATDDVGVTAYYVERCQGAGCTNFALLTSVSGSVSFNNTGLVGLTSYSFRVRARDAQLNFGPYSNVASATTLAADTIAPTAPSGLTATAMSTSQIDLSWTAATDNVGVGVYYVERCLGAGCTNFAYVASTAAGTTNLHITGLVGSTSYSFRVRANDAQLNFGPYSNVASATTLGASQIYFIHPDHLDTPRLVTNSTGQAVWRWDNTDPFGGNPPDQNPSGLGSFVLDLRFAGQVWNNETQTMYNYFRDCYDAATGRHCQSDPIGLAGGINTYAYVAGNPLSYADPLGLNPLIGLFLRLLGVGATATSLANDPVPIIGRGIGGSANVAVSRTTSTLAADICENVKQFGPLNPGPLASGVANTFRSGTYAGGTLSQTQTMYRVIGPNGNPAGSYWTTVAPTGPVASIIDSALLPQWGNNAAQVVTARIPAGTQVYIGNAASQGGLVGGGMQVYIPQVSPSWISGVK